MMISNSYVLCTVLCRFQNDLVCTKNLNVKRRDEVIAQISRIVHFLFLRGTAVDFLLATIALGNP